MSIELCALRSAINLTVDSASNDNSKCSVATLANGVRFKDDVLMLTRSISLTLQKK